METKLYYIHGLYGSEKSYKFLELKEKYQNIECLAWKVDDTIHLKLDEWKHKIEANISNETCIIASSTGCNFAYQLREMCKPNFIKLVFINPLFDISDVYDSGLMPNQLLQYLLKIEKHSESLLLFSKNDEVINHKKYLSKNSFIFKNNQVIINEKSTHNFKNLNEYYIEIDNLINAFYL